MKKYILLLLLLLSVTSLLCADVDYKEGYLLNSQTISNIGSNGAGYYFDGVNDYIDCGNDDVLNARTHDLSVSFWIKAVTTGGSFYAGIIWKHNGFTSNNYNNWVIRQNSTSSGLSVGLAPESGAQTHGISNGIVFDDNWHQVVVNFDRDVGIIIYIDGNFDIQINASAGFANDQNGSNPLYLGKFIGASYSYLNGTIDDVRIYSRTLSAEEIKDNYSGQGIQYKDEITNNAEFFTTEIDRTFTGGATHWTNYDFNSFDETTDLSLGASAENQYCYITFTDIGTNLIKDKQYRLTYDYSETTTGFEFKLDGATGQVLGDAVAGTGETIEFTAVEDYATTDQLRIVSKTMLAEGDFDNFSLKQVGCVLNMNSSGVGHNQWIDNSGNENNGTVNGAIPYGLPVDDTQVLVLKNITGETTKTNWLPKGYAFKNVISVTDANITGFDLGFSDGGEEIVASVNLTAGDTKSLTILQEVDDLTADDTFYISADNWNSGNVDLYITIQRMRVK